MSPLLEQTIGSNLQAIIQDQSEAEFAKTHDGCKNFIDFFNSHEPVILFSRFDRRTIQKPILNSICRHIKKAAKIAFYNIPCFDRRRSGRIL